jgi:sarcosine oxidase
VADDESAAMYARHIAGRLRGVSARVVGAKACLYTVTPDAGFIVDRAPGMDRVTVVSACSGHGFKHSAAMGEAIAEQVVDGASRIPLDAFALSRLDRPAPHRAAASIGDAAGG